MNNKIVGIFIVMLFIGTALTSVGMTNEINSINNKFGDCSENEYVAGEFIVKFKEPPFSSVFIDNLNDKYDVISMEKLFRNPEGTTLDNIYIIQVQEDSDILSIIEYYNKDPHVIYAEPNYICYPCGVPNDPDFEKQWALNNSGQMGGTIDADIDAPEAWDIVTDCSGLVIAVIDSGIDFTHPDLNDNIWVNKDEIPENGIDDDNNGFIDDVMSWDFGDDDNNVSDTLGHGTLVAGVIGAVGNNEIGISGTCWNCKIMPVKIYEDDKEYTYLDDNVNGIVYAADNGADIISMSFVFLEQVDLMKDAIDYAYNIGALLVSSAGNQDTSRKIYPAAYKNVIAVGATNKYDERCNYDDWGSSYGDWVDLSAPGIDIYTTMPTYHVIYNHKLGYEMNYYFGWGTSMACPLVSGVAALLLSRNNSLSQEEVKTLICENVDPYDSEYYIGTGRINAYKALSALNTPPNKPDIDGPPSGKVGEEQDFIISAIDAYDDDVSYIIDWGDDSGEETLGPFSSGEEQTVSHIWSEKGDYTIKVKAKDIIGAESDWAIFEISMPKSKVINIPLFLQRLFQRFPFFEKMMVSMIY